MHQIIANYGICNKLLISTGKFGFEMVSAKIFCSFSSKSKISSNRSDLSEKINFPWASNRDNILYPVFLLIHPVKIKRTRNCGICQPWDSMRLLRSLPRRPLVHCIYIYTYSYQAKIHECSANGHVPCLMTGSTYIVTYFGSSSTYNIQMAAPPVGCWCTAADFAMSDRILTHSHEIFACKTMQVDNQLGNP